MKLYVVRHGETEWNSEGRWQGRHNSELTGNGIKGAELLSEALMDKDIDLIISSPLKRTMHTTIIINNKRNIPVIYDNRIVEICCGDFEGKLKSDIMKSSSQKLDLIRNYPFTEAYPNGESLCDVYNRAKEFIDYIIDSYGNSDKSILVVTHGAFIVCLYNYIKYGEMRDWESFRIDNCSLTSFNYGDGKFESLLLNDTSYLQATAF